jgi:hypothetical protein
MSVNSRSRSLLVYPVVPEPPPGTKRPPRLKGGRDSSSESNHVATQVMCARSFRNEILTWTVVCQIMPDPLVRGR